MASDNTLVFNFLAKDKNLSKTFGKLSNDSEGLGKKFASLGKAAGIAVGTAAVGGIAALGVAFVQGAKAAAAYEVLAKKTTAVIKSTGNVANISVGGVQKLAGSLESLSGVDEELIINSQNVLATFTKIRNETGKGNDIFNQATTAALNMSVALGTDLQSATLAVGKALNDPIRGVTALRRAGVQLTEAQTKQIKTMVEAGDVMGAQKVILDELTTQFGGAAKAAGDTFTGKVARAKDALADMARNIAAKALPALGELADWVTTTGVPKFQEFITFIGENLIPGVVAGFTDLKTKVEAALPDIDFSGIATGLVDEVQGWAGRIIDGIQTGLKTGDWRSLGIAIGNTLVKALQGVGEVIGKLTAAFLGWFEKVDWVGIGIALGKQVPSLLIGIVTGILTFDLGGLLKGLADHWFEILVGLLSLAFAPVKLIGAIGKILAKIPLVGKLLEWGLLHMKQFADRFFSVIVSGLRFIGSAFLEGFRRVFPTIGKGFTRGLSLLPTALAVVALNVIQKAAAMLRGLAEAIRRGIAWVVAKIGELIASMLRPFANAAGWLIERGKQLVRGLLSGIANVARTVSSWIKTNVIDRITGAFAAAGRWLLNVGSNLIGGLKDGIVNSIKNIGSWIKRNVIDPIIGAVKSFFGIKSPSSVFAGIGGQLIAGLIKGLARTSGAAIARKIFGDLPSALGALVSKGLLTIASLPAKALNALGKLGGAFAGLFGGGGAAKGGKFASGVAKYAGLVSQVLAMLGQSQAWLPAVLRRMQRESGGNPRAINLWDSNAVAGTPSIGLMQTIGPTFAAYAGPFQGRGIYDPLANIYAGLNYALHRYGSLAVMDRPGGYWRGGIITEPIFGVGRSGRTYMFGERGPETVIPGVAGSGGSFAPTINLYGTPADTVAAVSRELNYQRLARAHVRG